MSTPNDSIRPSICELRQLSVLQYANGFTLWHYRAPGVTFGRTLDQDFWTDASDMIHWGDMVLVSAADTGGTIYRRLLDGAYAPAQGAQTLL